MRFVIFLLSLMFVSQARASDCGDNFKKLREQLLSTITEGKGPGRVEIPNVFPTTSEMVVANLIHQLRELWQNDARLEQQPANLLAAINGGTARFEHHVVWNWQPTRCKNPRTGGHSFLVVVRDKTSGAELGRASLDESGLYDVVGFPSGLERTVGPLHLAKAEMRRHARHKTEPFLISAWGTLRCDVLNPCLAMNDGDRVLIMSADKELYEMRDTASRIPWELTGKAKLRANERLMSVGDGQYAVVRRISEASLTK